MTTAIENAGQGVAQDYGETDSGSFVLFRGPVFGIELPNGALYREPEQRRADPFGHQPTVWFREDTAEMMRTAIAVTLEEECGIDPDGPSRLQVVPVELDERGVWRAVPAHDPRYAPVNPNTELVSQFRCFADLELDTDQAHMVMQEHCDICAGVFPCRLRGRARGLLARQHELELPARATCTASNPCGIRDLPVTAEAENVRPTRPACAACLWDRLELLDTLPWTGLEHIGGRKLVELVGR